MDSPKPYLLIDKINEKSSGDSQMLRFRLCAAATIVAAIAPFAIGEDAMKPAPGKQVEVKASPYNYLLFLPAGYEGQEQWPLVVFLHGAGERGDDLKLVKKHGPPKIVDERPEFEFLVASPQAPAGQRWEPEKVIELIDAMSKEYKVDRSRVYLTGLSLGGFGTWATAAKYPDRLAAIVPICGGGDPATAEKFKDIPVWVFHGAKDTAVPLKRSDEMVDALKKAGGTPKYTVYPDAGHDSWTESYNNPELYKWLLEQKRE
jgi:predicted peptidase